MSGISPNYAVGSTRCDFQPSCPLMATSEQVLFRYGHKCPRKVTPLNVDASIRHKLTSPGAQDYIYNQYTNNGNDLVTFPGFQMDMTNALNKFYQKQLEAIDELQEYFDTTIKLPKPTKEDANGDVFKKTGTELVGWIYVLTNAVAGINEFFTKAAGKAVGYVNILVFAWAIFQKAAPDRSAIYLNENFVQRFNQNSQLQNNAKEYLVALRNFIEDDRNKATSIYQPQGFLNKLVTEVKAIADKKDTYDIMPALKDRLSHYYASVTSLHFFTESIPTGSYEYYFAQEVLQKSNNAKVVMHYSVRQVDRYQVWYNHATFKG